VGVEESFPRHFFEAAGKAVAAFNNLKAAWMFIGAVPVATWGRVRATTDVDFAVSLDLLASSDLDREMDKAGFSKESGPVEIPGKRLILSKYTAPYAGGILGIDVFYTPGYDTGRFLQSALDRKVEVTFHGKSYWATSAEDLIVLKILAFRVRDLDDVATVLEKRFTELDWKHIHRWASALRIENLLTQVVAEYKKVAGIAGPMPWEKA